MLENISGRQVTVYSSAADCALFVVLAVPSSNKSNIAAAGEHITASRSLIFRKVTPPHQVNLSLQDA